MQTSNHLRHSRDLISAALLACMALLSQPTKAVEPDSVESRNKQTVTQAFDRWASGGNGFFNEMLATDVVWTIKGSGPSAGVFKGRKAFLAEAVCPFASRLSAPVRPVNQRIWAEGDHVIINWDGEGRARDGAVYRNSYVWIFRMHDGRAVQVSAYLDLSQYDDVLRRIEVPDTCLS